MIRDAIFPVIGWLILAFGFLMLAQSVYVLVTGRFSPLHSKRERALPMRPYARMMLFSALGSVAMGLPWVLGWQDVWRMASYVLALAFMVGSYIMSVKMRRAASSTESRDAHRTP
ncbi:hypothetical protein [Streptosporangium sp. V21-05]|uniref:hypothetical protein n=1 Tax=Streptosporangium sp. V21-05 TaxID=3446115 RepID=UPI003F52DDAE